MAAAEEERIILRIIAENEAKGEIDALVKAIKGGQIDAMKMGEVIDSIGKEIHRLSQAWGVSSKNIGKVLMQSEQLDKVQKSIVASATQYATLLNKISMSQAKARVSGMFAGDNAMDDIYARAGAEKSRVFSSDFDRRAESARQKVAGLSQEWDYYTDISQKARMEQQRFNKVIDGTPPVLTKTGKGLLSLSNIIRTAFGTITAIAVFNIIASIGKFFTDVFQAASSFRSELAELNLAEAVLSKKGMDITRKEFDDMISYIEERSTFLSKLEVTKVVADTAGAVQEFDVTKEQLGELADAIAFIQVKNKLLGREEADAAHIINAAMDARSNFFNGMGINITETIVKEKAYQMQLAKSGEELTKQQRFQAILALLTEQTADKQDELNKQLEGTPLGNQLKLQKEWADVSLRVGNSLITVRDNLVELLNSFSPELANSVIAFFDKASDSLNRFIDSLQEAQDGWAVLSKAMEEITKGTTMEGRGNDLSKALKNLLDALMPFEMLLSFLQFLGTMLAVTLAGLTTFFLELASGVGIKDSFIDAGKSAGEAFLSGMSLSLSTLLKDENGTLARIIKGAWKKFIGVDLDTFGAPIRSLGASIGDETPTGTPPNLGGTGEIESEQSDLQKALEKMNEEILEAQIRLGHDMEEAAIDLGRKLEDITIEYAKKRKEAQIDYFNSVRDINLDYNNKVKELASKQQEEAQKARNDELEREAEFQNKMLELKERYLMSLEEALHERDARQVLRLMKQYALDKLQAERDHALDKQKAANDLKEKRAQFGRERADAEADRKRKLADANRDYQDKLAQLKRDEEAERTKAQLDYERRMQDLDREMKNRLAVIGANLVKEFNLTRKGLQAIWELYSRYYTEIGKLKAAMTSMLAGQMMLTSSAPAGRYSKPTSLQSGAGSYRYAEGGSMIADRPTTVTFGDGTVPEMATFTPLGRRGMDVNKLFANVSGGAGGDGSGKIEIGVTLSPDLEARVVNKAMDGTANVIAKIQNSKVR